jgi:hypothetical protein
MLARMGASLSESVCEADGKGSSDHLIA